MTAALARNPAAPLFDVTSQLITPYQQALLDFQKKQLQQQYDLEQQRLALERSLGMIRAGAAGSSGGYGPSIYGRQPGLSSTSPTFTPPPTFGYDPLSYNYWDYGAGGSGVTPIDFGGGGNMWSDLESYGGFTPGGGGNMWADLADVYGGFGG